MTERIKVLCYQKWRFLTYMLYFYGGLDTNPRDLIARQYSDIVNAMPTLRAVYLHSVALPHLHDNIGSCVIQHGDMDCNENLDQPIIRAYLLLGSHYSLL